MFTIVEMQQLRACRLLRRVAAAIIERSSASAERRKHRCQGSGGGRWRGEVVARAQRKTVTRREMAMARRTCRQTCIRYDRAFAYTMFMPRRRAAALCVRVVASRRPPRYAAPNMRFMRRDEVLRGRCHATRSRHNPSRCAEECHERGMSAVRYGIEEAGDRHGRQSCC